MKIATIHKDSLTAGLSPNDGRRTEVFLAGCRMAMQGHPCPECFNQDLWNPKTFPNVSVEEVFYDIVSCHNPYVTIVGGEPLDQYKQLCDLMYLLRRTDHHIVLITHYTYEKMTTDFPLAVCSPNVIIDGVYDKSKRIFDTNKRPGIYHVIGSSNQNIWHKENGLWKCVDKENANLDLVYST